MKIKFTGQYSINSNTGGIDFQIIVYGQNVVCKVSKEALQDMHSRYRVNNDIKKIFLSNQLRLEKMAKEKILNNDIYIFSTMRCIFMTSKEVLL